ncbi:MAG: hypothetical protein C0491_14170 [Novosphingobium sp.]|nr:hypothetical protein [Novosphingobium sp.]
MPSSNKSVHSRASSRLRGRNSARLQALSTLFSGAWASMRSITCQSPSIPASFERSFMIDEKAGWTRYPHTYLQMGGAMVARGGTPRTSQ